MNQRAHDEILAIKLDVYRKAYRDCLMAYLSAGHRLTGSEARAEAERVMAETDRRIEAEHGGTTR